MRRMNFRDLSRVALGVLVAAGVSFGQDPVSTIAPPSVIFEALALNRDLPTLKKPKYRSPTDLVVTADESRIYICEQTAKRITVFDVASGKQLADKIQLPNEVTGCVVSADGGTLYATIGSEWWPAGFVCVVDVASSRVKKRIPVGWYPRSPVLSPDGKTLYVCNMFSNDISVIDVGAETVKETIDVVREPYSMSITPDGKTLVVGNSLPDDRSTDTMFVSCKISIIDVETHALDTIRLTRGSHSVFGLTIEPEGRYAFATHLIGKFNLIGTTVEKGWLHTNNLAMIDLEKKKFVNDVCLDLAMVGMSNPWGVKCTPDGEYMVIVHAGANEMSIIHLQDMIKMVLDSTTAGVDLQKHFTIMLDSRKRVQVNTKGPRTVAILKKKENDFYSVFTAGYFDDEAASMEEFKIDLKTSRPEDTYVIGDPVAWNGERNGESNYYDGALCFQKWQSCHSCHPLTRPDALNWILGGGAITAPKNAKSMLYSWWCPPTTWTGRRGHCQQSIVAGIELELFRVPTRDLAAPLDTFFMYLKPMMSPYLVKGRLSELARRGREIYYDSTRVDCWKCHPAPLFTDMIFWDAGVPDPYDANVQWKTPHLAETWRTGPYGHLGSYWGVREICELRGHSNAIDKLDIDPAGDGKEMEALVEYVLSL
jgi:YVTN family beta-propeller protein